MFLADGTVFFSGWDGVFLADGMVFLADGVVFFSGWDGVLADGAVF